MLFDKLVGNNVLIRPPGSPKISGKFRVTQDFGCTHVDGEPPLGACDAYHRGLDISDVLCGSPVFAAHAGRVQFAAQFNNGENCVILNHGDGWGSSYGHLAQIDPAITKDAPVKLGQRIGTIGKTGFANACHLHYAIKSDMPAGWGKLDFIPNKWGGRGDTTGKWRNPWKLLIQNVTIQLKTDRGVINIRTVADTAAGTLFAKTKADGTIHRVSDDANLGTMTTPRPYGGSEEGTQYVLSDGPGTTWQKIRLDGAWRYVAAPLALTSET